MQNEIKYDVIYSDRKTISLIVSPDKGVIVRAPYRTSVATIHNFVIEKESWIRKHLEKLSGLTKLSSGKRYEDSEGHLLLGKEYRLRIVVSPEYYVRLFDETIEVGTKEPGDKVLIKAMLHRFYLRQAKIYLSNRFSELISRYSEQGFHVTGLVVKPIRSRWGSCSSRGRITLSSELVKLDPVYSDYVIIHELCHLKHHNHGKEFYRLLGELFPAYGSVRRDLRQYITK